MCEVGLTLSELSWMLKHIKKLTKEKWVPTPLAQFAAKASARLRLTEQFSS